MLELCQNVLPPKQNVHNHTSRWLVRALSESRCLGGQSDPCHNPLD